jgi:hypothetical protein
MRKRLAKNNEEVLTFKVSLCDDPSISRELALAKGQSLYTLAEAIVGSFDFDLDHCFGFFSQFERWTDSERAYELFKDIGEEGAPNMRSVKKTSVTEAFTLDKKLMFLFDYGQEWRFAVELVGKETPDPRRKYPFLITKTGKSPQQYPPSED